MAHPEFWISFFASLFIGFFATVAVRHQLFVLMGLPNWDFTKSWASNITIFSGVINLFPLALLQNADKHTYTVLNFIFLLLPALAPLVYNFSRRLRVSGTEIIAQGHAFMFIVASTITLWGALGQIQLQILLLDVFRKSNLIPISLTRLFQAFLVFIGLGLLYYAYYKIVDSVEIQPVARTPAGFRQRLFGETHTSQWALL